MQRASAFRAIILLLLSAAAAAGCRTVEKHPDETPPRNVDTVGQADAFHAEVPIGATLDTVLAADLDGRGKLEYIVTSRDTSLPAGAGRATRVEVFAYDSTKRAFTRRYSAPLSFGTRFQVQDVTGDRRGDLVIFTNGGGNDPVASNGLQIGVWEGDSIRLVYTSDHGDPVLEAIDGVPGMVVINHQELWPPRGSHADAVEYVSDLLAYRGNAYASIRKERAGLFNGYAEGYLAEYRKAGAERALDTLREENDSIRAADSLEAEATLEPSPLYTRPALAMIAFSLAGDAKAIRTFWTAERDYIRKRIPGSDFDALEKLYRNALAGRGGEE